MSATLEPHLEPERPSRPSPESPPVQGQSVDGHPAQDDQLETMQIAPTALAEPEVEEPAAQTSTSAMIVFEGVRKVYQPRVTALDGVSFTIDKGEFVFIVGASGSGKSTIIRLLLKEIEPTDGRIIVGGRDLTRLKRSKVPLLRRNLGCVFQDFKLLSNRTAGENVAYALKVQGE